MGIGVKGFEITTPLFPGLDWEWGNVWIGWEGEVKDLAKIGVQLWSNFSLAVFLLG